MIRLTRALVRRWLDSLLHIDDTPERTAGAFALGVLCGFSPLLGLHTVLGVLLAFVLNLNRVAVLIGVYANLPWFLGPYYAIATILGAELIGQPLPADFRSRLADLFQLSLFQAQFWRDLVVLMRPLFWPYVVGSTLGSLLLAAAAYQLALAFVNSRRRIRHMMHHRKP